MSQGALNGLRIIELAESVAGEYCGKLLAALGADVIKVERPTTGSPTRTLAPHAPGVAAPESSAMFAYLNLGKSSISLDLERESAALATLLAGADGLIDDHNQGWLERLGVDPSMLANDLPYLVVSSITPFGYGAADAPNNVVDMSLFHASGWGYHTPSASDPQRPPLSGPGPHLASFEAGLDAALAMTAGLLSLEQVGQGQFIDVSMQAVLVSRNDYVIAQMVAGDMPVGDDRHAFDLSGPAGIFECRQGFVYLWMSSPQHWQALGELMGQPAWMLEFPERWLEQACTPERVTLCRQHLSAWLRGEDRNDISAKAQSLGLTMVPVNDPADLVASEQYQHRGYFQHSEHIALTSDRVPGHPFQLSTTPVVSGGRAPLLGQHNHRLTDPWTPRSRIAGEGSGSPSGPLAGVRVVELTKVWAGPYVGKLLTLLGAEVIRVESEKSLDVTRVFGVTDINDAPGFKAVNPQKLSVQVDMKSEQGIELIKKLVAKADIVVENLRPGAIERLGLGYESLQQVNPNVVYVAMSMWGNEGPLAYQTGYAPCFAALGGLSARIGYADEPPCGMNIRYADSTFGAYATLAALACLRHSKQGGGGQYVDVSAVESMSSIIGDAFVDFLSTHELPHPQGNRRRAMAPHGVWQCADGQWLSLAVTDDSNWQALAAVIGDEHLPADERFHTLVGRKCHEDELEQLIAAWCVKHSAESLERLLQSAGIAALRSRNSLDLIADTGLWSRGLYVEVEDSRGQFKSTMSAPWVFERGATIHRSAPDLGQHNAYVLGDVIGLDQQQQQALVDAKIIC